MWEILSKNFDTTHENYFDTPCINYSEEHDCIIICDHGRSSTSRLVISGISKSDMDSFRLRLNKENLNNVVDKTMVAQIGES